MIILMTLLIVGASMAFACIITGVAIEAAKNNQNAEATEVLRQP